MKATIKANNWKESVEVTFSNEGLNNYNFVDMYFNDENLTFSIDDLESIVAVFKTIQKNNQ